MPFAHFVQIPVSSRRNDSGKCGTVRHAVVVESEETDASAEDCEESGDAVREDQITGVVVVDILGREG